MTSIFGNLDMDEVSDDPFEVKPNTYKAVVVDAKVVEKDGNMAVTWEWKIDDPGGEFHNMSVRERFGIWPHKKWNEYTPEEKRTTKFFKKRLRTAFDMTKEQIDGFTVDQIIGKEAYITTVQSKSKKSDDDRVFTNIHNALCERLYVEQGGDPSNVNSAAAAGASLGI